MIRIDSPEQVAAALQFMRGISGMSQRELAAAGGFQQAQIHWWEHDERRPQIATLTRLLAAMGYQLAIVPMIENDAE